MISRGEIPAAIIAAPDGTYEGKNRITSTHSLWVNGLGGRFEDHVVAEVLPFVCGRTRSAPSASAHALLGISAGGYGAMAIAIKHRHIFGAVATIAGPLNMRYDNCQGRYGDDFDPATYRERTEYDPDMLIGQFYFGLLRRRVKTYLEPVYGPGPDMIAKVARDNPADLLTSTDLRPGELAIYVNYPSRDNYNFDAQDLSFAWLAAGRGVAVELSQVLGGRHNLTYIEAAEPLAYLWLGRHVLPPATRIKTFRRCRFILRHTVRACRPRQFRNVRMASGGFSPPICEVSARASPVAAPSAVLSKMHQVLAVALVLTSELATSISWSAG